MSAALKATVARLEQRIAFLEGVNSAIRDENTALKTNGSPGLMAQYNAIVIERDRLAWQVSSLHETLRMLDLDCRMLRERALNPQFAQAKQSPLPKAQWRRLAQLCHPDRHGNSAASTEAMKWLMEVRP